MADDPETIDENSATQELLGEEAVCDENVPLVRHSSAARNDHCVLMRIPDAPAEASVRCPTIQREISNDALLQNFYIPYGCVRVLWALPPLLAVLVCLSLRHSFDADSTRRGQDLRHRLRSDASMITLDSECHTAGIDEPCYEAVRWAKYQGIYSHPKWYGELTNRSSIGEFQQQIHIDTPVRCPKPCVGGNKDGSICPPPLIPDSYGSCNDPEGPALMTFYMYRAQGDEKYPTENLNLGDLGGVLWYLHNEVVASRPRKYHIDRIIRYKVTVRNTPEHFKATKRQFGPFVAFDAASAKGREKVWDEFGFVVGCQVVDARIFNYTPLPGTQPACFPKASPLCNSGKWYSLPGACPSLEVAKKTPECKAKWPGGACPNAAVTGSRDCTYWAEFAGQIFLDDLEGIKDYNTWWLTEDPHGGTVPNKNIEYMPHLDAGIGMSFWNKGHSRKACWARMEAVTRLFKEKWPQFSKTLPDPPCL